MDSPQGSNRPIWAFNQAEFERQERICKSKCYSMKNKVVADDDIVQEACMRGLRLAQRSGRPIWKAMNNQVFWRTNELCGHARRNAKSTQSIADIIGKSTPDVDDSDDWVTTSETLFPSIEPGYEDVERIDLIERIHAQISDHLVNVATLRCEGCTTRTSQQPPESQKAPSNITGSPTNARHSKRSPASASRPTPNYSTTSTPLPKPQQPNNYDLH